MSWVGRRALPRELSQCRSLELQGLATGCQATGRLHPAYRPTRQAHSAASKSDSTDMNLGARSGLALPSGMRYLKNAVPAEGP